MPKARKDKVSYERHNRIVHLLKTECSFPAASQTACMPPYSRFLVSHLRVRRMLTDMPAIDMCRKIFFAFTLQSREKLQPPDSLRLITSSHLENAESREPDSALYTKESQAERALFIIARSALACNLPY
jgi:hypothetical protein